MNEFETSWQSFVENGDFLSFTRQWDKLSINARSLELKEGVNKGVKVTLKDIGIIQFEPKLPSDTYLVISSGIHGNETAPIEIVDQFIMDIWSGKLNVKVNLLLIIGNPPAVNISKRFETQNLNRLFCGRYLDCTDKDYETRRAEILEKCVSDFYAMSDERSSSVNRYHFDLHTAIRGSQYEKFVLYPYLDGRKVDKNHIAFFGGADISVVLLGNQPVGTFCYFTSHKFKAMSATVELGKVLPFGENDMNKFSGIDHNLRCLIEDAEPRKVSFSNEHYKVFNIKQEIIKANEDFNLLLDDDVKNFTSFEKGHLLASDGKNEKYIVEKDGEAIVFPNNKVPVGQRVGVLLEEIEL
ncbi:MAG: succinylglutamate desuccinylase [Kangiellaceae bacterium]|nr:succinylglutamate desuccinylase [Kangiellaceae bacterium]